MELTTGLPCTSLRVRSTTSHCEESIMNGTRATSGSADARRTKRSISLGASSSASSMLMSIMRAPASVCAAAMAMASLIFPSFISRRNLRLPATLHRSPTGVRLSGATVRASRPASRSGAVGSYAGMGRGCAFAASAAIALMWAGVVPQHPPTMLSIPFERGVRSASAMSDGEEV